LGVARKIQKTKVKILSKKSTSPNSNNKNIEIVRLNEVRRLVSVGFQWLSSIHLMQKKSKFGLKLKGAART